MKTGANKSKLATKKTPKKRSTRTSPGQVGARPKFSQEKKEILLQNIREGQTIKTACALAGISTATYQRWINIAEGNEVPHVQVEREEYVKLRDEVAIAIAESQVKYVNLINTAALDPRNWKAAAYMLERHKRIWDHPEPQNSLEKAVLTLAESGGLSEEQVGAIYEVSRECMKKTLEIISRGNVGTTQVRETT